MSNLFNHNVEWNYNNYRWHLFKRVGLVSYRMVSDSLRWPIFLRINEKENVKMSGVRVAITIIELVNKYVANPTLKDQLPEFDFIWAIGQSVKDKGCYCGVSHQVNNVTPRFNDLVENLSPELITKISTVLNRNPLCFGVLKNHRFEMKCY